MTRAWTVLLAAWLVVMAGAVASAQESGQVGLTMGYPASIGVIWHASDTIALRPEFNVAHNSASTSGVLALASDSDGWTIGLGASALFYVARWDKVSAYVSPRFAYTKSSTTFSATGTTNTSSGVAVTGSFGIQFAPSRRFSVYGEAGGGYADQTTKYQSTGGTSQADQRVWSIRTAVGVIFYF